MNEQTTENVAEKLQNGVNGVKTVRGRSMDGPHETEPLVEQKTDENNAGRWIVQCLCVSMLGLALIEYVHGITNHSSLLKMEFAASVLAFITSVEQILHRKTENAYTDTQGVYLLCRTAGAVYYIACMFLTLTHCLEEISDIHAIVSKSSSENGTDSHEHSTDRLTLGISMIDLVLKFLFQSLFNALSIHSGATFIAVVSPSIVTISVLAYKRSGHHVFFNWLDHHVEPVVGLLLSTICIAIAVLSVFRKKQYLLAEGPKNFNIRKICNLVKAKHHSLEKLDHVHASCVWPAGFTVSLKAYVNVQKSRTDWVASAANDFDKVKTLLRAEILAVGATHVTIEPVFVDSNENDSFHEPICIDRSCHNEDVGCCTNPQLNGEPQA